MKITISFFGVWIFVISVVVGLLIRDMNRFHSKLPPVKSYYSCHHFNIPIIEIDEEAGGTLDDNFETFLSPFIVPNKYESIAGNIITIGSDGETKN